MNDKQKTLTLLQMNPYLSFKGQCEAAFEFYEQCLGGQLGAIFRYAGTPLADQVPADWQDKRAPTRSWGSGTKRGGCLQS